MNKLVKWILLTSISLLINAAYSNVPNNDHPKTFLGPTIKGTFSSPLFTSSGFSLLGEAGPRNLRIGGTVGFAATDTQRIKFSAEYLWQQLTYAFFSGNSREWMQQGAIGGTYQIDLMENAYLPQLDINAYYSHAPSKSLSTVTGTFVNSQNTELPFIEQRRVAGSNAAGISPGFRVQPWNGAQFRAYLNYDNVRYDKKYSPSEDAYGFGGTAGLNQMLTDNLNFDISAAIRKPFNAYKAQLNFIRWPYYGFWTMGAEGNYTAGKNTMPSSYNVGLTVDYIYEPCQTIPHANFKNEMVAQMVTRPNSLVSWIADPAVYMPQVLAVTDSLVNGCVGGNVILLSPIPDEPATDTTTGGETVTIDTASHFSGSNLVYSMTAQTVTSFGTPPVSSINPITGVVTVTANQFTVSDVTITVTANNGCSSASSTFLVPFISD